MAKYLFKKSAATGEGVFNSGGTYEISDTLAKKLIEDGIVDKVTNQPETAYSKQKVEKR